MQLVVRNVFNSLAPKLSPKCEQTRSPVTQYGFNTCWWLVQSPFCRLTINSIRCTIWCKFTRSGQSAVIPLRFLAQLSDYGNWNQLGWYTMPSFKLKFSLSFITSCYVILSLSMVQAMDIFMITLQDVTKPRENCNLKLPSVRQL